MPTSTAHYQSLQTKAWKWSVNRLQRRVPAVWASVAFVLAGLLYFFRWGSVIQHIPSSWVMPYDLTYTYLTAYQLAHGHFNAIYNTHVSFSEFPGIAVAMAPLGALRFHTTVFEVMGTHSHVIYDFHSFLPFLSPAWRIVGGKLLVADPQWALAVGCYSLLLSCVAFFACDALAQRLEVSRPRRFVLSAVEAVLLWNVIVLWGHPEYAVAIALAVYALIFVLDRRFVGAGWLFGAAVAFQPLVLFMLPVFLAVAGRRRRLGLAIRSIVPAAVLVAVPLIANFSVTFDLLAKAPNYPNRDHATPWTALSPSLGGHGVTLAVAGGPGRVFGFFLAVLIAIWVARRWSDRPELVVFACVVALALRSYTESVLDDYYSWAALAVGVVVAARCTRWRFGIASALAIATTVFSEWRLAWLPWWTVQVVGLTALLVVVATPQALSLTSTGGEAQSSPQNSN